MKTLLEFNCRQTVLSRLKEETENLEAHLIPGWGRPSLGC